MLVKNLASREFYHHLCSRMPVLKGSVCSHTGQVPNVHSQHGAGTSLRGAGGLPETERARAGEGTNVQNLSPHCTQVSFPVHLCLLSDKAGTVHYLHVLGCLL